MGFLGIGDSSSTVTNRLDPGMQKYRDYVMSRARQQSRVGFQGYGGNRVAGLDPSTIAGYEQMAQLDPNMMNMLSGLTQNLGMAGGPLNVDEFMDPYQQEVIGGMQGDFDRMRGTSLNAVGGTASSVGAFGGSRHGLAEGAAMGEIGRAEGNAIAGLRSSGYQNAVQNALANRSQMTNLGFGAAGLMNQMNQTSGAAQLGLGQARRGVDQMGKDFDFQEFMRRVGHGDQQMGLLNQTMSASPYGTSQTTETSGSFLSGLTGLAGMAGSFMLPGLGAAAGFAGNMFGGGGGGGYGGFNPTGSNLGLGVMGGWGG